MGTNGEGQFWGVSVFFHHKLFYSTNLVGKCRGLFHAKKIFYKKIFIYGKMRVLAANEMLMVCR